MAEIRAVPLEDRAVVALGGGDARRFLQGLITNDVGDVAADRAVYAALLTPQGKTLFDFFVFEYGGALHLDCAADGVEALVKRLSMYRLRADVTIEDVSAALAVTALPHADAPAAVGLAAAEGAAGTFEGGIAYVDPRCAGMGVRLCLPRGIAPEAFDSAPHDVYDARRVGLGIAEGSELAAGRALPLEAGLDDLHAIAFDKGCYVGQEVTARMKSRGLVRNRMVPMRIDGVAPSPDTAIRLGEREAGELRVVHGNTAIAMMKLDALKRAEADHGTLTAGDARLTPERPDWARF